MDTIAWNLIDKYFKENSSNLVAHHLDSYNDFFSKGIFQIFRENNPIRFIEREIEIERKTETELGKKSNKNLQKIGDKENPNECFIYLAGKKGDKIYFGKPIIYDEETGIAYPHYMYPNDARLRNMNYSVTIHYDVEVDFIYYNGEEKIELTKIFEKIYLGRFPIMIQSNLCILKGLSVDGFEFFTNYESAKGLDMAENPFVSVVFNWLPLQRQVRIEGKIEKLSEASNDNYFSQRPYMSQLGAIASPQSRKVPNRKFLEEKFEELKEKYPEGTEVPRPIAWGGYVIVPDKIEFWQGRRSRLHDRIVYSKDNNEWVKERLAP